MTYEEAKHLILKEGLSEQGDECLAVTIRGGKDPGSERITRIISAIDVLIKHEDPESPIERRIALALWIIGFESEYQSVPLQREKEWRDGMFNEEIAALAEKIEEYFSGSMWGKSDT